MEIGYGDSRGVSECNPSSGRVVNPTVKERLIERKNSPEGDLKDINNALEALEKNPEITRVLGLISKVRY